MKKIAITGKIGVGKTVLLNQFKILGYNTYSSDEMVKDLYSKDKHIINQVKKLNKKMVVDGRVIIQSLSDKAFNEPRLLTKLEKIIHPRLNFLRNKIIQENRFNLNSRRNIIIFEVPLLFEKKLERYFDLIILLRCNKNLQAKRVLKRANMNKEKFTTINKKFIPDSEKIKKSNYIIQTGIGKNYTMRIIKEIIKEHA